MLQRKVGMGNARTSETVGTVCADDGGIMPLPSSHDQVDSGATEGVFEPPIARVSHAEETEIVLFVYAISLERNGETTISLIGEDTK